MRITLTREDIKTHAAALKRIEELEGWGKGANSAYRMLSLRQLNSQTVTPVKCGQSCTNRDKGHHEEAIFRKHMDAAIDEALAYWRKQAGLGDDNE